MKLKEINLAACINFLGYGNVGRNVTLGLVERGIKVNLFHIGPVECLQSEVEVFRKCIENSKTHFDSSKNTPSLRIYHQNSLSPRIGRGVHFGWPIFELDQFTQEEESHIFSCDRIITCSAWGKKVVEEIFTKVDVCPLGVDTSIFYPNKKIVSRDATIFLNIGKWEIRKGHDVLVDIFSGAFEESDNVELWMCNHNPFLTQEETQKWVDRYKNSKLGSKIRFIPRLNTQHDVARLINQADCGIFPCRAEGWNLEPLEFLACGKEVIATNYSGQTEYLEHSNANLVDIAVRTPAYDGKWFFNQGKWANIGSEQIEGFITYMRGFHEHKDFHVKNNMKYVNLNGIQTAQKFSWKNTVDTLINILENS